MAFDKKLMAYDGVSFTSGFVTTPWRYGPSTDTIATIEASGYFDSHANQLHVDDTITFKGSDGMDLRRITAVSPNVTIAPFISVGDVADFSITPIKQSQLTINSPTGAPTAIHQVLLNGGATATTPLAFTEKVLLLDMWFIKHAAGAAGDLLQVFVGGGGAITDNVDLNSATVNERFNFGTMLPQQTINAGNTIDITLTAGAGAAPQVTLSILTATFA